MPEYMDMCAHTHAQITVANIAYGHVPYAESYMLSELA